MNTININRGEKTAIPFTITDTANGLAGMRVTWSVAKFAGGARILRKVGGLPGSTADITIVTQTAGSITGTINIAVADFALLPDDKYVTSLWVDDANNNDRCVTLGGSDAMTINRDVSRFI